MGQKPVLTEEQYEKFMVEQRQHWAVQDLDYKAQMEYAKKQHEGVRQQVENTTSLIEFEARKEERWLEEKRDWFAGQALSGWLSSSGPEDIPAGLDELARRAYEISDAMMEARKK